MDEVAYHTGMSGDSTCQQAFLNLAIELGALRFGRFTLKSGRESPYFFNAGVFASGRSIAALGRYYAQTIQRNQLEPDMLFGPAYKGIPIAAVTAAALADHHDLDLPFAYDRKEAKAHGEGGRLVGASVSGRVVIVDDVITAGTAVRHAIELIREAGGEVAGVVLALDRQERGREQRSAVQELSDELRAPVVSIASLADLIVLLDGHSALAGHLPAMTAYRDRYGVA